MNNRARRVLASLARGILGSGYAPEVPDRMLQTIDTVASDNERRRLLKTLAALDTRPGALLMTGSAVPVSWLSGNRAEAVIQLWMHSRVPALRHLANALVPVALGSLYGYSGPEWERIGYPGPLGPAPQEPKRLVPLAIDADEILSCDVVIVGSGAGGGCAAAVLAAAGLDVIVLEKGSYKSESDFHHREADATRELYLYGMTLTTSDLGCRIIAGSALGGGTVVNYTTSFKTPSFVLEEWARISGIDAFVSGEIDESLDAASERLGVTRDASAAGRRDEVLEEGLKRLGWHVDMLPRAVRGCTQDEQCGYCGFGCRVGAKQSTVRTYLEDAAQEGARIVTGVDVRRVLISGERAVGVDGRSNGHRLIVHSRAVVAAGGAIESPALLLRSGLGGQVGNNLHLHPGTAAIAMFDDEVRMWEGTTQSRYSAELRARDGNYGPIFETVPIHPGAGSAALPWLSAAQHRTIMSKYPYISFCAVLPRDQTSGRVRIRRDGSVKVDYRIGAGDARRVTDGVVAAGKVLEAAGATEVMSGHSNPMVYRPEDAGGHDRWAEQVRAKGHEAGVTFFSFHQMGSARMGADPSSSAVGPDNESHEVRDLYVMDASAFPTASGVNPMLSVYGIAHRAAGLLARRLS